MREEADLILDYVTAIPDGDTFAGGDARVAGLRRVVIQWANVAVHTQAGCNQHKKKNNGRIKGKRRTELECESTQVLSFKKNAGF